MVQYIVRRLLYMVPTLFIISILTFVIIQLPPGDFLTTYVANYATRGEEIDQQVIENMRIRYGLGEPITVQYWKWITGILLRGDFGDSFNFQKPVGQLIWERTGLTFAISLSTLLFVWAVSLPIGIYSAVKKYSLGDYAATFFGFLGLAIPDFLIALILMYLMLIYFNQSAGGLFSPEFTDAPWSWGKIGDLLGHLWLPMIIIGTNGTAGMIRIMRANLLDELPKPYVATARAKGMSENRLLLKYPVRAALNPFVSTIGWSLPSLVSGATIAAIVLNLPTSGPMLLDALMSQDMYLAGSFILILSSLTVIGTLISDILLAWLDPRIRFQ